jgi:hypothetical protein
MNHKFIYSKSGADWYSEMQGDVLVTPQNEGFDADHILGRLRYSAHTCEDFDGDLLTHEQRVALYGDATAAAGTRYQIRQVFGSRKNTGIDTHFGTHVPTLIVYDGERPTEVFPHRHADGTFATIRGYVDSL